jgi:NitT/TauT family transport system substrate-binding protein
MARGIREHLGWMTLALCASLALVGCLRPATEQAPPPPHLTLGLTANVVPPVPDSVLWLAADLGFYQREGLDVDLVQLQGTPAVVSGMVSGQVDVGNIGTEDVLRLDASPGVRARAIGSPDTQLYFLIAGRDSIPDVHGLVGRSFGVASAGSVDSTMTRLVLRAQGVDPGQVAFVNGGDISGRAQAVASGQLDATTMSVGTWMTIQHQPGVKVIVDPATYFQAAPIVQKVDAVMDPVATQKQDALRRFTLAIMRASRQFATDENSWVDAMSARRPDLSKTDLQTLWPIYRSAWAVNGQLNLHEYATTADFLYASDNLRDVNQRLPVQDWTDTRLVDAALGTLGIEAASDDPQREVPGP